MRFNNKHKIHNIPLNVRIGCLGLFAVLTFILVIIFVGFFQVLSFLMESWLGAIFVAIIILYLIYRKIIKKINFNKNKEKRNNNFTEADYIEIDDNEDKKS